MQKSRLASLIDSLVISLSAFLMCMIISTRLISSIVPRLVLSSILSAWIFTRVIKREKQKYKNQQLKIQEEKHLKNCIFELNLMKSSAKSAFLTNVLQKYKLQKGYKNIAYTYALDETSVDSKTMANILSKDNLLSKDALFILSNSLSKGAEELLTYFRSKHESTIKIEILGQTKLYMLMKEFDSFPVPITELTKNTFSIKKLKTIFAGSLSRQSAKYYLSACILLGLSSLMLPYKSYYLTISFVLLALGVISLLFGRPKHA